MSLVEPVPSISSAMDRTLSYVREFIWLGFAALAAAAFLFPVVRSIRYHFLVENALLIILSLTYLRYAITFRDLPWVRPRPVRWIWGFVNILLLIALFFRLQRFTELFESFSLYVFTDVPHDLSIGAEGELLGYIQAQILAFAALFIVSTLALEFRILRSLFRRGRERTEIIYRNEST